MTNSAWLKVGGADGNYGNVLNWASSTLPDSVGTGFFGTSNHTLITVNGSYLVGGWTFVHGASNFIFSLSSGVGEIEFDGAGIAINGSRVTILNSFFLQFLNGSTAGSANVINHNVTIFSDVSTAGNSAINNHASVYFEKFSTAGHANITNYLFMEFEQNSTAGHAAINNLAGGTVDFSYSEGPLGDLRLTAGSIAGGGIYDLGGDQLTVGSNGHSTRVSGPIDDGGLNGGTGASLV